MITFEKFIEDYGWKYKQAGEAEAAYARRKKVAEGIEITEDDFVDEAYRITDANSVKEVYERLSEFVKRGYLDKAGVLVYAAHGWCLRNPNAIIAYQESHDKWHVNNCGEAISEEQAIVAVNREWGFEASRIEIIGTPYYIATDWQFIRFDCAHMTWLWENGSIYQVYA